MSRTITVFKTHKFKLHNLSKTKQALINKTLTQSNYAFFKVLKDVKPLALSLIGKSKQEKRAGITEIKKLAANSVKPLPYGGAVKASTVEDVSAQASSFIELTDIGQQAGFPDRSDEEIEYHLALSQLLTSTTKEQEDIARDEMARSLKTGVRPLSYYKSRTGDGFLILSDKCGRLFAFLNLWSAKDKRASKVSVDMTNTRTGEQITFSTSTGLLVPLTCSTWHENALRKGQSKSAKLCYENGEYVLAVSVQYETDPVITETFMGIDKGIVEIATYAVRTETGSIIKCDTFDGTVLRTHQRLMEAKQKVSQKKGRRLIDSWSNYSDNLLHHIANEIIKVAHKHKSQVVIEDLSAISNGHHHKRVKGARKSNFRRMLSRQQYQKLQFMIDYKLQAVGLPKAKVVHAAFTSQTCPKCGHTDKANRLDRAVFCCDKCSYKQHADIVGAINIAGKRIWLDKIGKKLKKGSKMPEHLYFNRWQSENLSL